MKVLRVLTALLLASTAIPGLSGAVELHFRGAAPGFDSAAREYEAIWREHGAAILSALECNSGVVLNRPSIEVVVLEEPSSSGGGSKPMRLRASYSEELKRGTLVHELAHRYLDAMRLPHDDLATHQKLNLLLIPVWRELWGDEFVSRQVAAESKWTSHYRSSWRWALEMSASERANLWHTLRSASQPNQSFKRTFGPHPACS